MLVADCVAAGSRVERAARVGDALTRRLMKSVRHLSRTSNFALRTAVPDADALRAATGSGCHAASATTSCWKSWAAAAWAWSIEARQVRPGPHRGAQDDPPRAKRHRPPTWPGFEPRPRRPRGSIIRHIVPIYEVGRARRPAVLHHEVRARARRWRAAWPRGRCRRARRPSCWRRSAERFTLRTSAACCTAILKPSNILIDERRPRRTSPTSAWPSAWKATRSSTVSGADPRHALLHGARAGGRHARQARPGQRRLQPGHDPVPDAHRPAAVSGRLAGRHGAAGAGAGAAAAAAAESAGRPRAGNDRAEVPAKAAGAALCNGAGHWPTIWTRSWPTSRLSARSGQFGQVVGRLFRETHHATVLENWGLLWMWHSLALLVICLLTNLAAMARARLRRAPYVALWTAGLGTWAA